MAHSSVPLVELKSLKGSVPLWKKEIYVGGEEWIGQGS